jgi:hypothetical protein
MFPHGGGPGHIPAELGRLEQLQDLRLQRNELTGVCAYVRPSRLFVFLDVYVPLLFFLTFAFQYGKRGGGWARLPIPYIITTPPTTINGFVYLACPVFVELGNFVGFCNSKCGFGFESIVHHNSALCFWSGPIPPELGRLGYLKVLFLFENELTGMYSKPSPSLPLPPCLALS